MKTLLITLNLIAILLTTTISFSVYADGDEEGIFKRWFENKNAGISSVKLQQYNDLCGSCHFPYQPGLLPGVSWEKIMNNLYSHFGQPIKMTGVETRTMRRYLLDNSIVFHCLRHSCASNMAKTDQSLIQIGTILAHKSAQTTLRYSHLVKRSTLHQITGEAMVHLG